MIIGGIADLAGQSEADLEEITKIIRDLIDRSGKGK